MTYTKEEREEDMQQEREEESLDWIKEIKEARERIKKGEFYTEQEAKKILKLKGDLK